AVAGGGPVPGGEELAARGAGGPGPGSAGGARAGGNAPGGGRRTNLGGAPPCAAAGEAVAAAARSAAVEYDLAPGARGRGGAAAEALLRHATGAEAALVANNAAGGLLLALGVTASGRE